MKWMIALVFTTGTAWGTLLAAIPMEIPLDAREDGFTTAMTWGIGSDGYRRPQDPQGVFFTISDRGPNVDCEDSSVVFGHEICSEGKIFPMPSFHPSILKWRWNATKSPDLLAVIPLLNRSGRPVSGLSPAWKAIEPELPLDLEGAPLPFDAEGVDTEGLVVLADGTFWISEEYGPSLLHVSSDGHILQRWVPKGLEKDLKGADYPVIGKLPALLKKRKSNRGMEALALTPDESHLLVSMQSALENPEKATAKSSRIVRMLSINLRTEEVDGLFAYEFDRPEAISSPTDGSTTDKSGDLKISAMTFFGPRLIVQERTDQTMKLFEVTLGGNLIGEPLSQSEASPTLEESAKDVGTKRLLWDARNSRSTVPQKIEGIIVIDSNHLLLVNDNDFGLTGMKSEALRLEIGLRRTLPAETNLPKR